VTAAAAISGEAVPAKALAGLAPHLPVDVLARVVDAAAADRARRKVVGNWHKVGLDDCELAGRPASGELPDQQDRWPRGAGAGQQAAEVCIGRDEHPVIGSCTFENHAVVGDRARSAEPQCGLVRSQAQNSSDWSWSEPRNQNSVALPFFMCQT
jgi:hypothetical protein